MSTSAEAQAQGRTAQPAHSIELQREVTIIHQRDGGKAAVIRREYDLVWRAAEHAVRQCMIASQQGNGSVGR